MNTHAWHIQTLADACQGQVYGNNTIWVYSFTIDSRKTKQGDMFIALKTDTNDGHAYIQQAIDKGAVCVLVHHKCDNIAIPQIVVSDTLQALTDMGIYARTQFKGTVIGVTGSVGKTSVKDTLNAILLNFGKTQATVGNLNNHLGVPLSLLAIHADCAYAVIEMGMSAGGEIRHLTQIVRPHVAIVTAVDMAHLESFKNVAGIAKAKSEIFEGLTENKKGDKIAIYNGDSLHPEILQQGADTYANITFVYTKKNIISCAIQEYGWQSTSVNIAGNTYQIVLPMLGTHRVLNAVGVLHIVYALGLSITKAVDVLTHHTPSVARGQIDAYQVYKDNGHTISVSVFDETYNSSPVSLRAGLQVLVDMPTKNRRIAVIGDMLELGQSSIQLHQDIYDPAYFNTIDMIFLCGQQMRYLYGCIPDKKHVFWGASIQQLCPLVLDCLQDNDVVLVKGSRGMRMDILLQQMTIKTD